MEDDNNPLVDEPLPFSKPRQEALLGYTLINDNFFDQVKDRILKTWFVDPRCAQVYDALLSESKAIKRKLRPEELKECRVFMMADPRERERLCNTINLSIAQTEKYGLDSLTPELSDWLKARIYIEQVYKSRDLFNSSRNALDTPSARTRRDQAYETLHEMGRKIGDISFEGDGEVEFKNITSDLITYENDYQNALTFGSKTLDGLLLPEANGHGSLLGGDMTILLGAQNVGKSSCMLTVLAANLKAGKNAILIPHEGRRDDLKLKLVQSILGLTKKELFYYGRNPDNKKKFEQVEALLQDHLIYIPMIRAGLTVEEVGGRVRRAIDKFAAKHNGAPIHLLVDDYLARLTSVQNGRGQLQRRERDAVVYEYGVDLAGECNLHLLTGIQVNRTGNNINRKAKGAEDRLLVPEDVSESFGTMMVATNIISINRSPLAEVKNRVTFLICKSRSSETHVAVVCGLNTLVASPTVTSWGAPGTEDFRQWKNESMHLWPSIKMR